MRLTIVTGTFAADHVKPYGKHRHGHDWHVEARVPEAGHMEAAQERLDAILATLDHGFLDDLVPDPSSAGVAEWIGRQLSGDRVEIWRYVRGRKFGGEWRA